MTGIAQKIIANPEAYSIQMLTQGVKDGVIPAYIGIPLIQQKTQAKSQAEAMGGAQKTPPIAEEVLARAEQMGGVDGLRSNLPTQGYASGGIVAFEGGGQVERYQNKGFVDPATMTQDEREAQARRDRAAMLKLPAAAGDILAGPYNYLAQIGEAAANAIGVPRFGRALGIYDADVNSVGIPRIGTGGDTPFSDMASRYAMGNSAASTTAPAANQYNPATATRRSAYQAQNSPVGPGIDKLLKRAAPPVGSVTNTPSTAASAYALTSPPAASNLKGEAANEIDEYGVRAAARDKETLDKLNEGKPVGKPLEDYKKALQDEAIQAGADRADAKNMAIFKAGLAMMAGTSQHAFENIGKGAMVGAEDWQAANKDLKQAQRARQKELASIELAERAESRDDWKSAQKYRADAAEKADARDRFGISAIMNGGVKDADLAANVWGHLRSSEATVAAAQITGAAHVQGAEIGASARVQAAELRAALAGAGEKGVLTQDQVLKWREKYADHPEVADFKKQLITKYGANVTKDPKFQAAVTQKIDELLARDAPSPRTTGNVPGYKFLGKE